MRADGRPYISRRRRAADQADLDGRWAFHVEGVRTTSMHNIMHNNTLVESTYSMHTLDV